MSIHEIMDKELTWGQAALIFAAVLLAVCAVPTILAKVL